MKRIDINYDGGHYTLAKRDLNEVKAQILEGVASGKPYWLQVNYGEGSYQPAELLINVGASIVLIGVDPPASDEAPGD
ncbi:MAG: hypothetical protein JWQ43_730 [Glaciihabitans sp.]|nr:hypothetical protein [Glaciihabitans sp.]